MVSDMEIVLSAHHLPIYLQSDPTMDTGIPKNQKFAKTIFMQADLTMVLVLIKYLPPIAVSIFLQAVLTMVSVMVLIIKNVWTIFLQVEIMMALLLLKKI